MKTARFIALAALSFAALVATQSQAHDRPSHTVIPADAGKWGPAPPSRPFPPPRYLFARVPAPPGETVNR